ncbi:armadillo-type protein, partial [Blyttiomyces helicus]
RKVNGLLNQLTAEKLHLISDQIMNVGIDTLPILDAVVTLIFEKGIDEQYLGFVYADLCFKLSAQLPEVQPWIASGPWIAAGSKNNAFRRALLNKCQQEFESIMTLFDEWRARRDTPGKPITAEEEYEHSEMKRRSIGTVAFIGELYSMVIIPETIVQVCLDQLLKKTDDPEEESVEALCKLLAIVGPKLDHPAAAPHMKCYFDRFKTLQAEVKLPSRTRSIVKDLVNLRACKWFL